MIAFFIVWSFGIIRVYDSIRYRQSMGAQDTTKPRKGYAKKKEPAERSAAPC
jgi:hypothetical protein